MGDNEDNISSRRQIDVQKEPQVTVTQNMNHLEEAMINSRDGEDHREKITSYFRKFHPKLNNAGRKRIPRISSSDINEKRTWRCNFETLPMSENNHENFSIPQSSFIYTTTSQTDNHFQINNLPSEPNLSDTSIMNFLTSDSCLSSTISSSQSPTTNSPSPASEPSTTTTSISDSNSNLDISNTTYLTTTSDISTVDLQLPLPSSGSMASSIIFSLPDSLPESTINLEKELFTAARENKPELARRLLDGGISVNSQDKQQHTPLHCAVCRDHTEIVSLLLARSANVNVEDNAGNVALHFASGCYLSRCVKPLINAGADVNWKNNKGETPLHAAVKANNEEVVRTLLAAGARKAIEDNSGKTPFDLAQEDIFGINVDKEMKASICQILAP